MKRAEKFLAVVAASMVGASAARAGDHPAVAPPSSPTSLSSPPAATFDWAGHYAGAIAGYDFLCSCILDGVHFGYNVVRGPVLLGIEVETLHSVGPNPIVEATANARLGVILGERTLIFGQLGIGGAYAGLPVWTAGAGIEFAVSDATSIFAEARTILSLTGVFPGVPIQVVAGVNHHVGESPTAATTGASGFDWTGFYVGALGGWNTTLGFAEAGVQFGYNMALGRFVGGFEIETVNVVLPGVAFTNASLNARLGAVLGGRVFAYGEVGIGEDLYAGILTAGGGLEVAVGDATSVFGEALAAFFIGGGFAGTQVHGGVNWHLDR